MKTYEVSIEYAGKNPNSYVVIKTTDKAAAEKRFDEVKNEWDYSDFAKMVIPDEFLKDSKWTRNHLDDNVFLTLDEFDDDDEEFDPVEPLKDASWTLEELKEQADRHDYEIEDIVHEHDYGPYKVVLKDSGTELESDTRNTDKIIEQFGERNETMEVYDYHDELIKVLKCNNGSYEEIWKQDDLDRYQRR